MILIPRLMISYTPISFTTINVINEKCQVGVQILIIRNDRSNIHKTYCGESTTLDPS
jgi:hypothetical protein